MQMANIAHNSLCFGGFGSELQIQINSVTNYKHGGCADPTVDPSQKHALKHVSSELL